MDDVERVARAIMLARGGCNVTDWNERTWNPAIQQVWDMARAAMAATREIDAEAVEWLAWQPNDSGGFDAYWAGRFIGWLQQRATQVKGSGNG
jgi:hypothetical protein